MDKQFKESFMPDILKEFEKRIAANKRDLEEQEKALAVLKRTMGQSLSSVTSGTIREEAKFDDLFNGKELSKKRSLVDDIRDVVGQFGSNEFTVAIVEAALAKTGVIVGSEQPRARIAVALGKLVESKAVSISFKGAGKTPNIYKLNGNSNLA
jgi:hypothetical protein